MAEMKIELTTDEIHYALWAYVEKKYNITPLGSILHLRRVNGTLGIDGATVRVEQREKTDEDNLAAIAKKLGK